MSLSPPTTDRTVLARAASAPTCQTWEPPGLTAALGEVSEGAIRTAAMIRWPQRIKPRSSYAMFSIMDFFPTLAHIAGGKIPDNRPIDGVDQSKLLLGEDDNGARQHLLTFARSELVAVRWKQFRAYFADVAPGRSGAGGAILMEGVGASAAPMNGYPRYSTSRTTRNRSTMSAQCTTVLGPILKAVADYKKTLVRSPNPPAANMTKF